MWKLLIIHVQNGDTEHMNEHLNLDAVLQENANMKPQALNIVALTRRQGGNAKNRPRPPLIRRTLRKVQSAN